jgi:hypothetical protein
VPKINESLSVVVRQDGTAFEVSHNGDTLLQVNTDGTTIGLGGLELAADPSALPTPGESVGQAFLVVSEGVIRWWNGDTWAVLAGTAAGSTGGQPQATPVNLFIGGTLPTSVTLDSLWLPSQDASTWQVITGTGNGGDGGNLILSTTRPIPAAPLALWIPLNADGSAKPPFQWELVSGSGTAVGNTNLFMQTTRPTAIDTAFWVKLTASGQLTTPDQWEVAY